MMKFPLIDIRVIPPTILTETYTLLQAELMII